MSLLEQGHAEILGAVHGAECDNDTLVNHDERMAARVMRRIGGLAASPNHMSKAQ